MDRITAAADRHNTKPQMTNLKFTATIVKRGQGCYIARSPESSIAAEPASTQRSAIKKLKDAVLAAMRQAATDGRLASVLEDAGYISDLLFMGNSVLNCHVFGDSETVSLPLPNQLATIDRNARRKWESGDETIHPKIGPRSRDRLKHSPTHVEEFYFLFNACSSSESSRSGCFPSGTWAIFTQTWRASRRKHSSVPCRPASSRSSSQK